MRIKKIQCKHIPTIPILKFLEKRNCWCNWFEKISSSGTINENSVQHAFHEGTPEKLVLGKMRRLIKNGFVAGCNCGCRGDFHLTEKGKEYLKNNRINS